MTRLRVFALLTLAIAAVACATNPVTGKRELSLMSEAQEIQMGQEADQQVRQEMGIYDDPALQQYVARVGQALAAASQRPNLPWHFAVVDSAAVNAFALPGGYVYVTRGILPFLDNEAQLAGVMGHEIGHVTARHAAQQYTRSAITGVSFGVLGAVVPATQPFGQAAQTGLGVLFLKYGRDDELQADRLGVEYGSKAGWDPRGVSEMLTTLGRLDQAAPDRKGVPSWLSTHPQPATRVQDVGTIVTRAEASGGNRQWKVEREAYLQMVDGVIFGDDPRQGIVRGADFLHPNFRIALTFPSDWQISNGATQVVAKAPDADLVMLLTLVQKPRGSTIADIASAHMTDAGFRRRSGSATTINGVAAYVGTFEGTTTDGQSLVARAGYMSDGGRVYFLAGLATPRTYQQGEPLFTRAIQSFRRMSASEADAIRPSHVQLYTARAGDTWQSMADRSGSAVKASTLAIMNDRDPTAPPRPGERLKIVVQR